MQDVGWLIFNVKVVALGGASLCEERVGAERRQKSEERNTNREGVAAGSAT